ncbi:MAG: glycoside hydrolase family 9 protein [Abitibacteriaceae bacterium]|nr:glycoside hydrolase family 9 protein [Abditibacteriaceae bacterium]MBV9864728.1 glycoside hydrolase family 9 protein [Abditibacteriaceae bacterium]
MQRFFRWGLLFALAFSLAPAHAAPPQREDDYGITSSNPLAMPQVGESRLRVLAPTVLELTLITTKLPDKEPEQWNFIGADNTPHLPALTRFQVTVNRAIVAVKTVGFKRRVLYAPLAHRDLRIGNYLYLQLSQPVPEGAAVEVSNPDHTLWGSTQRFSAVVSRLRWSPVIHVNQVGYVPAFPKQAMVGYYLGNLGELDVPALDFKLVKENNNQEVFSGHLTPRHDQGYSYAVSPYQRVLQADFSTFKVPGQYRLIVPGLGASFPFWINDGVAAAFARTYALGLYHQRCGAANVLPFTRFTHAPCHTAPADVPTMQFKKVQQQLADMSNNYKDNPRHTAPQLKDVASSLYPFVNTGNVDVSGGHHDAGDYSKYTTNSAQLIHHLIFAVDAFPGVGDLDNLGLPESGDGKSDLLQIAKWEADFLAKMQDADGGFYFLVYPRERAYENNVLPDQGDPQVVFPKNTAVTAAATAALAQAASSPRFKREFPAAAALYLAKAKKGWAFLQAAQAKYGRDGSYQKLTHYGDTFMHDDELAWAATEMFLATGDPAIQTKLVAIFDPTIPDTRRWTWMHLFEAYGCAIRSYAFAARTGRISKDKLNPQHLAKCEQEIIAGAEAQLRYANGNAYGTSFPFETKQVRAAGWYFPLDGALDLAVATQLEPRPEFLSSILTNLNYEGGTNPNNVTFLTGLGWKRQREIVHQYAMNDRRVLPPSGIPLGSIQEGFMYLEPYKKELGALTFPADGDKDNPFPFYDRWGDSFNVATEFVAEQQARALATLSLLMTRTPLKSQAWRSVTAKIIGVPARIETRSTVTATLKLEGTAAPGLNLDAAQIVWEASNHEPVFGRSFSFIPTQPGPQWIEAEAQWPDGRRAFAVLDFEATDGAR